jgi:hypothetical protein
MNTKPAELKIVRILSWLLAGIFILLPFHAVLTTWIGSNTGRLDLVRIWKEILILLMLPLAGWIIFKSENLRTWFKSSPILWLIRLYILLHLILGAYALSTHQVNSTALIYALIINLRLFAFFLLCYAVAAHSAFLKRYWRPILLFPALAVIAFGLAQPFLPIDFLKHFGYGSQTIPAYQTVDADINYQRIQSTLRGANPLGAYLVLVIPALLLGLGKYRLVRLAGLAAAAIVLFHTYSRSAWIGTVGALSSLEFWKSGLSRKTKQVLLVLAGILTLAGAGAYALRSNPVAQDTLLHTSSDSVSVSSNAQRAAAIKSGLGDVISQPLGRGPGTAGPASFRNNGYIPRISENYFLQIGQEVGIVGMLVFISINALVAQRLWLKRDELLAQILLASLVGITLINLVSHAWTDDTLALLWWGLAGICLAPLTRAAKASRTKDAA